VALTAIFLIGYLLKGFQVGWQLFAAVRGVGRLTHGAPPAEVAAVLKSEPFKHLWAEYSDTLHELKRAGSGAVAITEVRATMPAEMFFTRDVLVDSRLFDDFTRHLPGVLTGLGIIGTFAGLLEGLGKFDASSTATAVAGLKPLLDGVAHAFIASAIAIACAMLVVFISRLVLALFYRRVERLNQIIDALYSTGAGEEYLARLVSSSEKAEAHAAQLKQALVEDLTTMMTNLVERQIAAQAETSRSLGNHIGEAITGQLAGPLQRMTEAMETSSKGNTQAVSGMLESMLAGFMQKLEDTFGGQMRGIHEQMDRSMAAMGSVQQALQKLVEDINRSNEQATNRLTGTLEDAMKQSAANQQLLTDQMREFVQEFRRLVTEEQDKSKRSMDEAVGRVLEQLSAAVAQMEAVRAQAATAEQTRSADLSNRTEKLVGGLSDQVQDLLKSVADQVAATQRNIDAIGSVTTRAIEGMNSGALTMGSAARQFETAGNSVTSVFERSGKVADQLTEVAASLQTAATAVRQGFEQYDQTRKTVDANVQALTGLIESTKREAGLTKQMITDLERIVAQLRAAEEQTKDYLEGVNEALETAFDRFGSSLLTSVKNSIGETDRHLSSGVQQLNGVVQEIGVAISRLRKG
jgi:methyl-accepting chemotaxis protein